MSYNPNATTPEEHLANCEFQLKNVEGYLEMLKDGIPSGRTCARLKAQCLLESAQKLVASFERRAK